jgi:beta-N-acetylhexosaminidase
MTYRATPTGASRVARTGTLLGWLALLVRDRIGTRRTAGALTLATLLSACGGPGGPGGPAAPPHPSPPPAPSPAIAATLSPDAQRWVDSTLASLDLHDLVAQLIFEWIPGSYVSPSAPDFQPLEHWVEVDHIGGVSPSIGLPHSYVAKLNALQKRSKIPLLVASDFEDGGPGMRINGSYALPSMLPQGGGTDFPPTMAFGAIGDDRFAYEYGRITAEEARATGVQILFAPVLDVNSNPDNPVIGTRSFGADPQLVARLGADFIRGAHAGGALTTAKHFPGHGDTSTDTHLGLAVVPGDRARLDSVELVPFERAIAEGVDAVMTAHVELPGLLGPNPPPATLSPEIVTGLLRAELGFKGVVFTDALTMGAITQEYGTGQAAVRALEAGADVLLSPTDVPTAIDSVTAAVRSGRLSRAWLEASVRRLLVLKARLGLQRSRLVSLERVDQVVGSGPHLAFADSAATRSITLPRDTGEIVPLRPDAAGHVLSIRYAPSRWLWAGRTFSAGLRSRITDLTQIDLDERSTDSAYAAAAAAVQDADHVVVSAYVPSSAGSGPDAVPAALRTLVAQAAAAKPTILISFGSPYLLNAFPTVGSYMEAWGNRPVSQRAALKALLGEEGISGRLPVPLPPYYALGDGLDRPKVAAAQSVADPGNLGMDATALARVDSIVRAAVADSAASGAALAIGRHGRLVDLAGYGDLAYGSHRPATPTSIWDLASLTKVVGTTTETMMLVQEGRLDLDAKVVSYLPWWSRGDPRKNEVTVRELLMHDAGLPAFRKWYFDHKGVQEYKDAVADEPLIYDPGTETIYSDIGIMTLGWILESIQGQTLDTFLQDSVFRPLGMLDTQYKPPAYLKPRIAAEEVDTIWRHRLVWGEVHDENADAMGGVSGHAGLFSTAVDLSVFAQMMLNHGTSPACTPGAVPGDPCPVARPHAIHLLDSAVVADFTRRQSDASSRALGWDTPAEGSSAGDYLSPESFGHTGFTGTSIWMDPKLDLWVILLTNRVHPTRANEKIIPLRRAVADAAALAVTDVPVPKREWGSQGASVAPGRHGAHDGPAHTRRRSGPPRAHPPLHHMKGAP